MSQNTIQLSVAQVSALELVQNLEQELTEVREKQKQLKQENCDLKERIKQLEGQLAKNSSNSSKPPSSNGFKRPPKSRRTKSGKKQGGQKGHPGCNLRQVTNPDFIIIHTPKECQKCGASLESQEGLCVEKRQVFDIPEPKIEVTEYQVEEKRCSCGCVNRGSFPEHIKGPAQYGPRIHTYTVYFLNQQLIPVQRVRQLYKDIFGVTLSAGTIESMNTRLFMKLESFEAEVKRKLVDERVVHFDETGMRCEKTLRWAHVASSLTATFYAIHSKRGQEAIDAIDILPKFGGTAVHDHWKAYFSYEICDHGLCNAHHDRELEFIHTEEKEAWGRKMQLLLYFAKTTVDQYMTEGAIPPKILEDIEQQYCKILKEGLDYHSGLPDLPKGKRGARKQRPGKNLLDRLQKKQDCVLRFIYDFSVPFTNNLGEQDIRMMKLKQKISGCFRTTLGGNRFCRIRSYISTARKQAVNIFQALFDAVQGTPRSAYSMGTAS